MLGIQKQSRGNRIVYRPRFIGLEEEGIKGGREREFRPRIRLFVSGRVRGWNGRLSESTLHRQRSEAVYRDRKPICNVLRAGFEILNSKRKEEVDDHPSFGSCSSFSRFLSPRQQLILPPFFFIAHAPTLLHLFLSLNSYVSDTKLTFQLWVYKVRSIDYISLSV